MRQLLQSIWWWLRVAVMVTVGVYVLALFWKNTGQTISLWYWPNQQVEQTSVVALALASFIAGGVVCTIGWALFSASVRYRRSRAERKRRLIVEHREAITRKAAMLRVKPAPAAIIRAPKRAEPKHADVRRVEHADPIPLEPAPIEMEMTPPPAQLAAPKSTFSTGAIPVEVDDVIVMTPPPRESIDDDMVNGELGSAAGEPAKP